MLKIFLIFIFLVFVGNMVFLDYLFVSQNEKLISLQSRVGQLASRAEKVSTLNFPAAMTNSTATAAAAISAPAAITYCPQNCVTLINNVKNTIPKASSVSPATSTNKGEYFVPLGSGTISTPGSWVDIYTAQGAFDTANYPAIKAFYFEVVMHIPSANGQMKAKLIDDSTPFNYDGQVLTTSSSTGQLLSVQVPLIAGKKTYHVRLFTSISEAVLDSARIRIVTQ